MRRLYVRGLIRQLTSPALLAASYSGTPADVASALVQEIQTHLEGCLQEVGRLHESAAAAAAAGASGAAASEPAAPPDWVHIFLNILQPVTLSASDNFAYDSSLDSLAGCNAAGFGAAGPKVAQQAEEEDSVFEARVAGALRAAAAAMVGQLLSSLRQVRTLYAVCSFCIEKGTQ